MNFDNFTKLPDELKYRLFKDCVNNNSMLVKLGGPKKEVSLAPLIGVTGAYHVSVNPVNHDGPCLASFVMKTNRNEWNPDVENVYRNQEADSRITIWWVKNKSPCIEYYSKSDDEELDYIVRIA